MPSILTFCIICNFGSLSQRNKGKFERIRKMAQRTIGVTLPIYDTIYEERLHSKVRAITSDPTFPLFDCYVLTRSGIRFRAPRACKLAVVVQLDRTHPKKTCTQSVFDLFF